MPVLIPRRRLLQGGAGLALLPAAGCGGPGSTGGGNGGGRAGEPLKLIFWHTRRERQEALLKELCADYGRQNPGIVVEPVFQGSYDELNKKTRAAIRAGRLPALSVAYESHVTEYMANGVVRALDDLVKDPEIGFSDAELADIPPLYLESNRFRAFENRLLSFPFTKSNLMMYYNKSLLKRAGFGEPPETWPEFEKQAAAVARSTGHPSWAFAIDASTIDGIIYSFGGDLLTADGSATRFDAPAAIQSFELLRRLAGSKTLLEAAARDTGPLFISQRVAFYMDSSSGRDYMESNIGDRFDWDVAVIPHAPGVKPVTVMYGPNVCIFTADARTEREAWKFVRHFVSPPITARWARETGYLPVRRSAVELPEMKEFYSKNQRAWHVYQALDVARPEPNVVGWQEVRKLLERTARSIISTGAVPQTAAAALKKEADQVLRQSR